MAKWYNVIVKKTHIDTLAESIQHDNKVRNAITSLAIGMDESTKNFLIKVYTSQKLRSIYDGLRNSASISGHLGKTKDKRHVAKFPNLIVHNFLNDIMRIKYGDDWITDTKKFARVVKNEELVKPWLIDKV